MFKNLFPFEYRRRSDVFTPKRRGLQHSCIRVQIPARLKELKTANHLLIGEEFCHSSSPGDQPPLFSAQLFSCPFFPTPQSCDHPTVLPTSKSPLKKMEGKNFRGVRKFSTRGGTYGMGLVGFGAFVRKQQKLLHLFRLGRAHLNAWWDI